MEKNYKIFKHSTDQNILNQMSKDVGLLDKIFGGNGLIMYNQSKEKAKRLLYHIYGYKKINEIFPPELDEEKVQRTINTIFRYNIPTEIEED